MQDLDEVSKQFTTSESSGIILTSNETKDIVKVVKSLENRAILLRRTSGKIISKEGGLLNFLDSLIKVSLSLIKNVLLLLAKNF